MLQIMRAAMRVETNMRFPVPTSGEDGEQSVMGESHSVNSDLVWSESVWDIDTMHVEFREELIVLSCVVLWCLKPNKGLCWMHKVESRHPNVGQQILNPEKEVWSSDQTASQSFH